MTSAVGRELRMKQLKEENEELKEEWFYFLLLNLVLTEKFHIHCLLTLSVTLFHFPGIRKNKIAKIR